MVHIVNLWFRSNHFLEKFKYMNNEYADDEEKCENIRFSHDDEICTGANILMSEDKKS